jgi:hypothetical protein
MERPRPALPPSHAPSRLPSSTCQDPHLDVSCSCVHACSYRADRAPDHRAHPLTDRDSDSCAFVDSNALADVYTHACALVDSNACANFYTHACADVDANALADVYTHVCADVDANALADVHTHACADVDTHTLADRDSDSCADVDANACADLYTDACADVDANALAKVCSIRFRVSSWHVETTVGTRRDECGCEGFALCLQPDADSIANRYELTDCRADDRCAP